MYPRDRYRPAAFLLLFAACASQPKTREPVASAPSGVEIQRALDGANKDAELGPRWSLAGTTEVAGVVIERYRVENGPTLLLSIDRWSPSFVLDTWTPVISTRALDLEPVFTVIARRRRAFERRNNLIVDPRAGFEGGWLHLGAVFPRNDPACEPIDQHLSRAIARLDEANSALEAALPKRVQPNDIRARLEAALRDRAPRNLEELSPLRRVSARLDPSRTIVVAVGALDRIEVLRELRRALADPRMIAATETRTATATFTVMTSHLSVPSDRAHVLLSWPLETAAGDRAAAIDALSAALASDRLAKKIGARTVEIGLSASEASFEVLLGLEPSTTATRAVAALEKELQTTATSSAALSSLPRTRASLSADLLRRLDAPEDRARAIGLAQAIGGGVEQLAREADAIERLDAGALQAIVSALSTRGHHTVIGVPVIREEQKK